ncbi:54S ribosomal protein L9, mitochondrial [Puccinia graminis f. sp. tritici]|uniref:Large ribosomal subunit protein uL3m n=2 Tax=Puccinia graminis f. sp. tritici TaxID=56615 RepID=A0A5B0LQ85_PUCGR|nr:54S ribosomal protein L9, mitochondrial [Puccinia graminis f. sp. tritici]
MRSSAINMTFFHHHPLLLSSLLQLQIRAQPISSSIRTLATLSTATTTPSSSPSSSTPTEPTTSEATIPQSTPSQSPTSITELINPPQKPWMPGLRRTGVLARKRGMTSFWDSDGIRIPVTVLELEDVQVVGHKYKERDNYDAIQIGCTDKFSRNSIHNAQLKYYKHLDLTPKQKVTEFVVSNHQCFSPIGTSISAAHFVPGQFVDVKSNSKGKGFAGVMKRWGFSGGNASHGSTKHHRKAGSTGQHQDPGRVWPGKKMAGRMGNQPVTVRNLLVARIDTDMNLIYVKGQVPGPKKAFVRVTDAEKGVHRVGQHWIRKGWNVHNQALLPGHIKALPFPTIDTRSAANLLPDQISLSALSKLKNTKAVE